ncbi:zinc-binding dehydrogenase [Arthrobacter sp. Hor0625]|uniref:zinc-binding dehydrogenase n=1 Tax=Arthrobacter sp. Hor0625 TaxID=3457358 RepID=UPI00403E3FDF
MAISLGSAARGLSTSNRASSSPCSNTDAATLLVCIRLFRAGKLRVEVAQAFQLARAADAFRLNMEGHTRGKIVVTVDGE